MYIIEACDFGCQETSVKQPLPEEEARLGHKAMEGRCIWVVAEHLLLLGIANLGWQHLQHDLEVGQVWRGILFSLEGGIWAVGQTVGDSRIHRREGSFPCHPVGPVCQAALCPRIKLPWRMAEITFIAFAGWRGIPTPAFPKVQVTRFRNRDVVRHPDSGASSGTAAEQDSSSHSVSTSADVCSAIRNSGTASWSKHSTAQPRPGDPPGSGPCGAPVGNRGIAARCRLRRAATVCGSTKCTARPAHDYPARPIGGLGNPAEAHLRAGAGFPANYHRRGPAEWGVQLPHRRHTNGRLPRGSVWNSREQGALPRSAVCVEGGSGGEPAGHGMGSISTGAPGQSRAGRWAWDGAS